MPTDRGLAVAFGQARDLAQDAKQQKYERIRKLLAEGLDTSVIRARVGVSEGTVERVRKGAT